MTEKLNRYMLTDEIYRILKDQILSNELTAGERINIDQFARSWGVSNIPIREALSRLVSDGLATMIPYRGVFVSHMSLRELKEIHDIRMLLEPFAVVEATQRIPDEELQQMKESTVPPHDHFSSSSGADFLEYTKSINELLHGTVVKYTDNHTLELTLGEYNSRVARYLSLIVIKRECDFHELAIKEFEEHYGVLECLLRRDAIRASDAMRLHLTKSYQRTSVLFVN